jgi:transposase
MIGWSWTVRVMVAAKPVDFARVPKGLASLWTRPLAADSFSGRVYVFRAKRAYGIKLIYWDRTDCVCSPAFRIHPA